MPELPDVEGYRRMVARHLAGERIEDLHIADPSVLGGTSRAGAMAAIRGRTVGAPLRHGKWLIMPADGPTLLVHFGMTGSFVWTSEPGPDVVGARLTLSAKRGALHFVDRRRLGRVAVVSDENHLCVALAGQGPDALSVSATSFTALVGRRRGTVKSALIDQSVVAGIGNMLSDEILWRARLHPATRAAGLSDAELARLHRTMRSTLRGAVAVGHIPRTRTWLSSQRDHDPPVCPRCRSRLSWSRIAGRSSLWCEHCQPAHAV